MADDKSMTVRAAASKLLVGEHADVLREAVRVMLREVMEAEVSAAAGADWYERSPERETHRNGYRQREWDTRVGTVELAIPRLRTGSYLPSFLGGCGVECGWEGVLGAFGMTVAGSAETSAWCSVAVSGRAQGSSTPWERACDFKVATTVSARVCVLPSQRARLVF